MKNICVFASGNGSNFEAIAKAVLDGRIKANLKFLLVDKKDAYAIKRAEVLGIKVYKVILKNFIDKVAYEKEIIKILKENDIDYIFLAGYMKIITNTLLGEYNNKIINIHPSLLPAFKGAHAISDAYNYGVKVFGVTIHYVDSGIDSGKIISQGVIDYVEGDSMLEVETKIHQLEHVLYVDVIKRLVE